MPSKGWAIGQVLTGPDLTHEVDKAIKAALSPAQTMALTMWAEARSSFVPHTGWVANPIEAMQDIGEVIDARATDPKKRWPGGHKTACLWPWAFSCWGRTGGLENYLALMVRAQRLLAGEIPTDKLAQCLQAADRLLAATFAKTLPPGTCHYYADWMLDPPPWAFRTQARPCGGCTRIPRTPVAHRYGHLFFTDVP